MKTSHIAIWITMALLPFIAAAERPNILGNSGFEDEDKGQWLDYNFGPEFGIEWGAQDEKRSGKGSLKLIATKKTDDANKWEMAGAKQIFPVNPGDVVSGGAWLKCGDLKDVEVFIECKWLDADQKEIGGIGTPHKTKGSSKWEYQNLESWSPKERTAPTGAAFVDFRLTLVATGTADKAEGIAWWDDAEFVVHGRTKAKENVAILGSGSLKKLW